MKSAPTTQIIPEELIDELRGIVTEGIHHYRWTLIRTNWEVGRAISDYRDKLPKNYVKLLSPELHMREREIYKAVQFFEAFPTEEKLDSIPGGKNISWHKICHNLLPEHKEEKGRASPEELFRDKFDLFCKAKNIEGNNRQLARQLIEEWENFKEERGKP